MFTEILLPRDLTDLCVQGRESQKVDNAEMMFPRRHLVALSTHFSARLKGFVRQRQRREIKVDPVS